MGHCYLGGNVSLSSFFVSFWNGKSSTAHSSYHSSWLSYANEHIFPLLSWYSLNLGLGYFWNCSSLSMCYFMCILSSRFLCICSSINPSILLSVFMDLSQNAFYWSHPFLWFCIVTNSFIFLFSDILRNLLRGEKKSNSLLKRVLKIGMVVTKSWHKNTYNVTIWRDA